jgi:RHS repeat-associated protein
LIRRGTPAHISDDLGPVSVTVDAAPTVSLDAPGSGAVYAAPATIVLSATARDTVGTITKVDFYQGITLIGTATAAPYTFTWTNVAAGLYSLTAVATNDAGMTASSSAVSIAVDAPPSVALTAPSSGTTFTAPANIAVAANVSDTVGTVTKVDFYRNGTLITSLTAAPYSFTWTGVPAGSYSLTAVATNDSRQATTSAAVAVTVKTGVAQMYFIEVDHLNTPRAVSDGSGTVVWRWDQTEPFNTSPPDQNPSGLGVFEFPLGFPGQYFDKETGNWYNGFRDYASSFGRYVQSDPIGLKGGLNTYAYAGSDPLRRIDPAGLLLDTPPVEKPPVRPPSPPAGPGRDGPDCTNIPPWTILVAKGGIWGFMRTVTVQCSYYCPPPSCPRNPGDYVYHKTFEDQLQIAPWLSPCPPKVPRSEFF